MVVWLVLACTTPSPSSGGADPAVHPRPEPTARPPDERWGTLELPGEVPKSSCAGCSIVDPASSREGVERDLREGSERARACWTAATARTPNLTGQVELGMGLYDHHAESVFVIANATGDAELPACLIDAMKAWPFPSVARETNVSWSFGPGGPVWATERGARVHTVSLTMRGGDDAPGGAVSASVRRYSGQLRYCYDQALKQAPELAGTLEVTWTLAGGKAERVQANGPGLDALATCVAAKAVRWTFPSDLEGDVRWTVRFALEP